MNKPFSGVSSIRTTIAVVLLVSLGTVLPLRASAQSFNDVASDYWAYSFIEILVGNGITAGCGGSNYCPEEKVTRAQMAVFLERGMNGSSYVSPAATGNIFFDVSAGDFAANFIEDLFDDGITAGCGNNNYCPDAEVSRAEMAVFLLRAKYGAGYSPPAAIGVFGDVDLSYWAVHWIEQLATEGITTGCGSGDYCPETTLTRAQMAVFLVRTFSLVLPKTATVKVDPDQVVMFEADRRTVSATVRDSTGAILSGAEIAWTSLDDNVATVDSSGEITAAAVGITTIQAAFEGQQGDATVTVTPPISTYEDYKEHFPYQVKRGQFVVGSDIGTEFSQQHLDHLLLTWQYFSSVYSRSPGTYTEVYYTRDLFGLYARIISSCPTTIVVGGRNLTACFDNARGVYIWFVVPYIEPDFGTQLHEIGHSFLYFTQTSTAFWPWLNEGISMYWESGSFDNQGSFSVSAPMPYLVSNFRRVANANGLVSLPTLFQLTRNQFYGDPDPAKLYSQSGMLLYYLFDQFPAVAQGLVTSINNTQITTNAGVVDYILQQTGLTVDLLETNYTQYALQF